MTPSLKYIVEQLTKFPHRAITSKKREEVFQTLSNFIKDDQVEISRQYFTAPPHYIRVLRWLMGGLALALFLAESFPWLSIILSAVIFVNGFLYFDWRDSLLTKLPPQVDCFNFIARKKVENTSIKIILMAHWDTAPITIPYRAEMIKGLRSSIFIGQTVMFLCVLVCMISLWESDSTFFQLAQVLLIGYLVIQLLVVSIDYWRFGYSNGANDNATGCALALSVAHKLWGERGLPVEIEVCITGAEEVGMLGAKHYWKHLDYSVPTYVINFDTIGCEQLHIITKSGTFTPILYDQAFIDLARQSAAQLDIPVLFEPYHTADVDTAWFARSGTPSLTFISQNSEGIPAYIHRPEDTIDKIHWTTLAQAEELAHHISLQLIKQHTTHA